MTRQLDSTRFENAMECLLENGFDGMADVMRILLNEAMKIERNQALCAQPYERTAKRQGYANGFKPKTVSTRIGQVTVDVPQTRGIDFYPSALERGTRSERALILSLAEMYVQGVSTRKVTKVLEKMCGLEVTSTQVSRAAAELDQKLEAWRNRALTPCPYLILDARYEKIRVNGTLVSCALLSAIGVDMQGKRRILGCSVSLSEAETHWRDFLESLQARGLKVTTLITSDDHAGLKAALRAVFPAIPWQRCQCHLQRNAQAYIPKASLKEIVPRRIRAIFNSETRPEADERLKDFVRDYQKTAPKLAAWAEENIPEGLTVFILPEKHRVRMRTSNSIENVNNLIRKRTRVATIFPNEDSLLRLATAVLSEISDEWETGKVYLNMKYLKEHLEEKKKSAD